MTPLSNIPRSLGVPALKNSLQAKPLINTALGIGQAALWSFLRSKNDNKWGIYDGDNLLGVAENYSSSISKLLGIGSEQSTKEYDYRKESKISEYPLESGSFATYNKVKIPEEHSVTICYGGTLEEKKVFMDLLDKTTEDLKKYTVVTPEITYYNANIYRLSYRRTAISGSNLLIITLWLKRINEEQIKVSDYEPKKIDATPSTITNTVQTQPAPPNLQTLATTPGVF